MLYLISLVCLIAGLGFGYWLRKQKALSEVNSSEAKAEKILTDAKTKENQILIEAQEKSLQILADTKKDIDASKAELQSTRDKLEQRENLFSQKLLELQDKQQALYDKIAKIEEAKEKIKTIQQEQVAKLEKIANLSTEEAKDIILKRVERDNEESILSRIKKLDQDSSDALDERTREIMSSSMQRLASTFTAEITTTTVDLPSDEMKGRIIGREGRNIKAIENLTGVEIIIDDVPNIITVSGFSGIRRQIAKRAIEY
ncbi:MAG TPA: Rnase Y domain-containing protein, partial [bacterium]|nr:Rnase Y domain-containing protein [bacterium]